MLLDLQPPRLGNTWCVGGSDLVKTRVFTTSEPQVFYHCPQCFVRVGWGVGGIKVLGLCILTHITHAGCYASRSVLAHEHMRDVTLADLLLHLHTCGMLRYQIFCGTCTHCYASRSSLALAHMQDVTLADLLLALARLRNVTLADLLLHLPTWGMLR